MNERSTSATVGDIVASDFRAAAVFERFGIDFCCGGRRSLGEACRIASLDPQAVLDALDELPSQSRGDGDVTQWPIARLIDHIVSTHHAYVRSALPTIARHLTKLVEVHGTRHPELTRVQSAFDSLGSELEQHMFKEEHVLFPYVRDLSEREGTGGRIVSPFGTVANPIRMMEREHLDAADGLRLLRELTRDYTTPEDGCTTYQACMSELARFEEDLHLHVHLENNVLFPRALRLEEEICGAQ